jgi:small-conductance mechanosensitive channel
VNVSPFLRNLGILAVVALVVVAFNQETALATAGTLLRIAFFIVIGVVAYFFWRDIGRQEINTWPDRAARIFYAAVGLLVLDLGWYLVIGVTGRNALAFFVVAAICVYVGVRTWRDQKRYI